MKYDLWQGAGDVHYLIVITCKYHGHLKGDVYHIIHITYRGSCGVWIRTKPIFKDMINRKGKIFRRFSPISAEKDEKIINKM